MRHYQACCAKSASAFKLRSSDATLQQHISDNRSNPVAHLRLPTISASTACLDIAMHRCDGSLLVNHSRMHALPRELRCNKKLQPGSQLLQRIQMLADA